MDAQQDYKLEKTECVYGSFCLFLCVYLLVVFSEAQQQLVVKTLEVLSQQRAEFNLRLTLRKENIRKTNMNQFADLIIYYEEQTFQDHCFIYQPPYTAVTHTANMFLHLINTLF